MRRFAEWNHLQAIAFGSAARAGYSLRKLQSKSKLSCLMKARRSVIRDLRDAGASWERCGQIMRRHPESLREMAHRYAAKEVTATAPDPNQNDHDFLCDCDDCLNGVKALDVAGKTPRDGMVGHNMSAHELAEMREVVTVNS